MKAPLIDQNGDLVFQNGDMVMVDGDQELVQSVESILKTVKGELFMDEDFGLSHDNLVGKQADKDATHDDIVEAISQESRISSVEEIDFNDDRSKRTRSISLSMTKADQTGEISLNDVGIES
ncbi:DUF2634 domain-containing protein [Sporolactobacillus pectinivorans]|uniref:DUF2634 domain-containing protein n=1 Tax=Sporolactobacillus pectinivorans TaxID=1591408 RepID=UPI000C25E7B7|nr:DUF2634 domain-containing protein [Sporolactobacillus pectinivorans]